MSQLLELQRRVAAAVMQPLTRDERMRRTNASEANALIKPNTKLTSFERLEIYNRQYWFRVLSCFAEDFPGLRAIVGSKRFEVLSRDYLQDCPSVSFTLRNLGSQLERWLSEHLSYAKGFEQLALDMVRLEWAHIEAFDGLPVEPLRPETIAEAGLELRAALQPYVRLLKLAYPVDDLLIEVRQYEGGNGTAVNAARLGHLRRRVKTRVLPQPQEIYLAAHRFEDSIYYKRLEPEAFVLLDYLANGNSLEEAIDGAFTKSEMAEEKRVESLGAWFGSWAEMGWFCQP